MKSVSMVPVTSVMTNLISSKSFATDTSGKSLFKKNASIDTFFGSIFGENLYLKSILNKLY